MSSKCKPPKFITDASQYAEYRKNLLRWSRLTNVEKKDQAETVLYSLLDDPSGIQQKIDTALGDEIVEKDDGLAKLIEYLDTIYKADEMALMRSKYKKFTRLKKVDDQQPITEFIAEFESAYKEAKDNGCEVSDTVLALSLLDSCNLSEIDEKFVLTDVNFKTGKEQQNCLQQVKQSLRKFQSRERLSQQDQFLIKEEDVFLVKGALIADGWRPPANSSGESSSSKGRQNSPFYQGRKNKLGLDGKPMICFKCNSEYHFSQDCDKDCDTETEPPEKPTDTKKKKGGSAKGKKKQTEKTMLSQLLAKRTDYSMMCEVHESSTSVGGDTDKSSTDIVSTVCRGTGSRRLWLRISSNKCRWMFYSIGGCC